MRPLALILPLAALSCAEEPCPAGSSRGADGLCVLSGDSGAADGSDGADGADGADGGDGSDGADGLDGDSGAVGFLGAGTHSLAAVEVTVIADASNDLVEPRDLAFDPFAPTRLWVVDRHDHAMVILTNPGTDSQSHWRSAGSEREHWLAKPSALAFGQEGFLATAHDSDNNVREGEDASFQMGPTLWPSDPARFDGGRPSHLDMVHDPALMNGIAWQEANVYWIHDGWNGCLTRMDFVEPHEPGGTWHSDAVVDRFACGQVGYLDGVPAHMEWDAGAGLLWFADPDRGHVASLDPTDATESRSLNGTDDAQRREWEGADLSPLAVDGLEQPSGLALHDGLLLVSDAATSRILALSTSGEVVDWLDTELPASSLAGLEVGPDGALWVVDRGAGRVLRYAAP